MTDLLVGPAALAVRYVLILAAGWLASQGFVVYDAVAGTVTLHIESASAALGAAGVLGIALVWRKVAQRLGGRT